jgi:antitoxin PrlF
VSLEILFPIAGRAAILRLVIRLTIRIIQYILNYQPLLMGENSMLNTKCCQVEAIVSVDARGQIVLPKEVRDKAGVKAGDKFVLVSSEDDGKICCLFLVKADQFVGSVKEMLGPVAKELLNQ